MNLGIEILGQFLECLMQMLCIHALLDKKIKIGIKALVTFVIYITLLATVNIYNFSQYMSVFIIVILYIYVRLQFKIKNVGAIIVVLLNIIISSSVQLIGSYPIILLFEKIKDEVTLVLIINLVALLLMILLINVINLSMLYNRIIKWDKLIVRSLGMIFILFSFLYVNYKRESEMMIFAYFVSSILVCLAIKMALDWNKDRYEMKQKSIELHMHELYGKTFESMIENIRIRQHDFKNQIAAIYGMHLTAENFEELVENQKKYCDYLMEESRYDSILTKCNDKILAGFLYTKLAEWERKSVEFHFDISLNNSSSKLATYELIKISGILIDNAAEAEINNSKNRIVEFIIEDTNEKITIISRNQSEYVSMEMANAFFKKGYSTKGSGRGLGLYDMKKILDEKGEIMVNNKLIDEENYIELRVDIKR